MKKIIAFQAGFTLVVSAAIALLLTPQSGASFLAGGLLIVGELASLVVVAQSLIRKKSIALTFVIIVLKYPLLAGVIYYLTRSSFLEPAWFLIGIGSLIVTALVSLKLR